MISVVPAMWSPSVAATSFLAAFAVIFTVSNPIGCALIYSQITVDLSRVERIGLARRIAINSALVLVVSTWAGGVVLGFLGVGIAAFRIAGGLVVAEQAWRMLRDGGSGGFTPERRTAPSEMDAFFPLTIPFTTGPGTIAAAIGLGAGYPLDGTEALSFILGVTAATAAVTVLIGVLYGGANRLTGLIGAGRAHVVLRLSAFLLLCIGVQILMQGLRDSLR